MADEQPPTAGSHMPDQASGESFSILKHSLTDEVARIHGATKMMLPSVDDASSEVCARGESGELRS